ncbi:MAG TPA: SUMF1/EgtB/PvdO family nonheme iron enzyme [Candidatus Binatia bacterium]|jgi:hypothetical protein|nr:SUMF1/EgtB/PvdO family nonheme iron enzyme [Candidatus Binatia bacterium]
MSRSSACLVGLVLLGVVTPALAAPECPPDAARVGELCVDRYEASVWAIPPTEDALLARMRAGTTTADELHAAGAVQIGCGGRVFGLTPAATVRDRVFVAQSLAGVLPSTCITWDEAARACATVGKRLPSIMEWQAAAAGTPRGMQDDERSDCNLSGPPFAMVPTGSRARCVSSAGVYDMPGNVEEWVHLSPLAPDARVRTGRNWYAGAVDVQFWTTRPLSPTTGFRCVRQS